MASILYIIILLLCGVGLSAFLIIFSPKFLNINDSGAVDSDKQDLSDKIAAVDVEIRELLTHTNSYGSKGQFDTLIEKVEELNAELVAEQEILADVEAKLDTAQSDVETKESYQQTVKSSTDEDEQILGDLLGSYKSISTEAADLEQQLADSLKVLDKALNELELTKEQKSALEDLQSALSSAGTLLRDLITEYATTNDRLSVLREQHDDLEEEYTKLVEQQLGE